MNKIIGDKLKMLRKQKGWSQEQASDYLAISQSAYARIENGVSYSWANHLEKICEVFSVTLEELVKKETSDFNDSSQKKVASTKESVINQLSEKLIEQYEERIKELQEIIIDLKSKK